MHPKAVALDLGGQTRYLVYDFNALCALKDNGVDALSLNEEQMTDPRTIRALIWAGLLASEPSVTLKDVGGWMDPGNLAEVAEAFRKAMEKALQRELPPDPR